MPHPNNKDKNTNPVINRQDYHLTSPAQQRKKKLSINLTLQEAYTIHWTNLRRAETKRKKEFNLEAWEKNLKHNKLKKIIMKRQRNTTQMKEQTRNTEVQINEEI